MYAFIFSNICFQTKRGFGFAEPYCIYESLTSLVLHYSKTSLEEHNEDLRTTLKFPVRSKDYQGIEALSKSFENAYV
jgi:hypothetical protein